MNAIRPDTLTPANDAGQLTAAADSGMTAEALFLRERWAASNALEAFVDALQWQRRNPSPRHADTVNLAYSCVRDTLASLIGAAQVLAEEAVTKP